MATPIIDAPMTPPAYIKMYSKGKKKYSQKVVGINSFQLPDLQR
jgi:hypothetical protein